MTDPARAFGTNADAYHRARPPYPAEAVAWLTGAEPRTVLEVGAGTGKLTAGLVAVGHDVQATDPDPAMLAILRRELPDVPSATTPAEEIPAPDNSFDVVVAAQCLHWFDLERALPEFARVLRPGGTLAMVWNHGDERIPWVRRLRRMLGEDCQPMEPPTGVEESGLFGPLERADFRSWHQVNRETIGDLARSRSTFAVLDDDQQESWIAEVLAFYDGFGRGMDGLQMPYVTSCFRTTVISQPGADTPSEQASDDEPDPEDEPQDGTDTDLLLIDFR